MTTVFEHYETHLAPIYLWMAGGFEHAIQTGRSDLNALGVRIFPGMSALDLGAGFGMHAIPLGELGCSVTAVDTSALLLKELEAHSPGLGVRLVESDLLRFRSHVQVPQSLVLCMGDTLTHLQSKTEVMHLLEEVAQILAPDGAFAVTFRNYTAPGIGTSRFIPVRSDENRIHTCFLEEESAHMNVYDIIHQRSGSAWQMAVSSYKKLRIEPSWLMSAFRDVGLAAQVSPGPRGLVQVVAHVA